MRTTLAIVLGLNCLLRGAEFQLRPGEQMRANNVTLDVGDYAIPSVVDWNGDGRKDLIIGYRYADKIALYLNTGTDQNPVFGSFVNLQAGGLDIQHPSAGCGAPAPFVCDYDGDGRQDLLAGTGVEGYVYFYRNTNTQTTPILAPGVALIAGGNLLTVPARATPCIWDWDGDGLKDLLCGAGDGYVYFFRNVGTAEAPVYPGSSRVQAGGTDLNLGYRSVVRIHDWDGDGIPDLLGSSATGVYWCRNSGSRGIPMLAAPAALRAPVSGNGLAPINTGPRMRLDLVDWNDDGQVDLLVGNTDGTISYFEGYQFALTRVGYESATVVLQWNSSPLLKYDVLAGASPEAANSVAATGLESGGKVTAWTNATGPVQGFYRIRITP